MMKYIVDYFTVGVCGCN